VIPYLLCFVEWLIACPLSAFLPFLCLLTDSLVLKLVPCPSLFLWCTFSIPAPSAVMLDYSLLFIIQLFGGDKSAQRLC
jgi:hypothetical protein